MRKPTSVFRIRFQISDNYCSNFYLLCYLINGLVDMERKEWSFRFGIGQGLTTPHRKNPKRYELFSKDQDRDKYGCFDHGNEPSVSIKCRRFLN